MARLGQALGRAHPHQEIKIVDPVTGETVPRGKPGEFCTRGYLVMLGYWEDPEKTVVEAFPMTVTIRKVVTRETTAKKLRARLTAARHRRGDDARLP